MKIYSHKDYESFPCKPLKNLFSPDCQLPDCIGRIYIKDVQFHAVSFMKLNLRFKEYFYPFGDLSPGFSFKDLGYGLESVGPDNCPRLRPDNVVFFINQRHVTVVLYIT